VWGPQPPEAGYVHGLVVHDDHVGAGLGRDLLRWAADRVRGAGRTLLRLDCGDGNAGLRRYYTGQGFRVVARLPARGAWYAVVLLEQQLQPPCRSL
jgi:GNAT superfamily N-acetyltransferase